MEDNNVATMPQETIVTSNESIDATTPQTNEPKEENVQAHHAEQIFKLKVNHDEVELPYSEMVKLGQKGMDYDRVKSKYEETKPVLSFVEELAQENGMSVQDYLNAAREYREAERIRQLAESEGISEELAQRLTKLENSDKERQQQESQRQQEARKQAEYQEFFEYFEKENGRSFDTAKDSIPDEVWQGVSKGKTLLDAFQANEAKVLKDKIRELESKLQIQQTNTANNATSTGSVTGNGATNTDFISQETFNNNKQDRSWIIKNFDRINQSRKSWTG